MTAQNAVRTVHIRGVSEGLGKLEEDLRAVGDAQENLAQTSEATARTTETASRRQMSVAGAYNRLLRQIDQQFRAQQQLERGQQTLDRAFQQGLATQAEYDRAMAQLRDRYMSAAAANDNATRAAERHAAALRDMAEAERLAASISDNQMRFNSTLGVGDSGASSARESAAVFEQAAREAEVFDASVAALRAQLDPLGAATQKLNAELATYADMAARGAITSDELAEAQDMARQRFEEASGAADKSVSIMDQLWSSVSRLVLAYAGLQGARLLGDTADQWSEIQARVVNATGSFEAGQAVLGRLGEMARRTYSDLGRTAESWLSSSRSLSAFGVSIKDQLDLVETFNNALVVSATRGQRAESVQRAWSDAMALGKMNLDQFNSIMTGSDRLAQALADSMGVNVIELRKLASEGKITRQSMLGLTSQLETLRAEADAMPATIADGLTLIRNAFLMTIGMMDQAGGASESFAAGLVVIADNMGRIVTYAMTAAAAYGVYYAATLALDIASKGLAASLVLVRAALIRIGIGALVVAAGELAYQFSRLVHAAGGFGNAMSLVGDVAAEVWERIKIGGAALEMELSAVALRIKATFLEAWAATAEAFAAMIEAVGTRYNSIASLIPGVLGDWTWDSSAVGAYADEVNRAAEFTHQLSDNARTASERMYADMQAPLESIAAIRKTLADAANLELPGGGGTSIVAEELDKNAKKIAEAYKRIVDSAQDFVRQQQLEASLIGMSEQAANALRYEFDLLNEARRAGITLTDGDRAGFKALAEAMAEAEERTRSLTERFEFIKDLTKGFFNDFRQDLIKNMSEGMSFWESAWRAMGSAAINALDKIVDKLMSDVLNALFEVKNAGSGGGGGGLLGFLGGLLGMGGGGSSPYLSFSQTGQYLFDSGGAHLGTNVVPFGPNTRQIGAGILGDSGFGPQHFPAVLKRGESVLTAADMSRTMQTISGLAANQNNAKQSVHVTVGVSVDRNGNLQAYVKDVSQREGQAAATAVVQQYDREVLADRVNQIANDPHARG